MSNAESDYMFLINDQKLKPEEARSILPNDCATEIMVTGFESDWKHFFKLRTAFGAHPDDIEYRMAGTLMKMKKRAPMIAKQIEDRKKVADRVLDYEAQNLLVAEEEKEESALDRVAGKLGIN